MAPCSEGAGEQVVYVYRRYVGSGTASCTFFTANITATAGSDYTAVSKTLTFANPAAGNTNDCWLQRVNIPILQDSLDEDYEEKYSVNLSGSAVDPDEDYDQAIIRDDEGATQDDLFINNSSLTVREGNFVLTQVTRQAAHAGTYLWLPSAQLYGNATQGLDFTLDPAYLDVNETAENLVFRSQPDSLFEPDETATIRVSNKLYYTVTIEDDDPYIPVAGRLVAALPYAKASRQALIFATITSTGTVSGKATLVGQTLAFTGRLDARGRLQVMLAPKGRGVFFLSFAAQDDAGRMSLTLNDAGKEESSATVLVQNFSAKLNPCPLAAAYTVTHGSTSIGPDSIYCTGANIGRIDSAGNALFTGRVFDGTSFTCAGYVDGEGNVWALATLYGGAGHIGFKGPVPVTAGSVGSLIMPFSRPARAGSTTQLGVFASATSLSGGMARYTPPAKGERMLECWSGGSGIAELFCPGLFTQKDKTMTISPTNKVSVPMDAEKLKITLTPSTGFYSGSFIVPGTTRSVTFHGVVQDLPGNNGQGRGFFLDGKRGGSVRVKRP